MTTEVELLVLVVVGVAARSGGGVGGRSSVGGVNTAMGCGDDWDARCCWAAFFLLRALAPPMVGQWDAKSTDCCRGAESAVGCRVNLKDVED